MKETANRDLSLGDVPPEAAEWDEIGEFALTFNGYEVGGSFEKCAEIANSHRGDTLAELRTCLFFEQRRYNLGGWPPDAETMVYIRCLVQRIRAKVAAEQSE